MPPEPPDPASSAAEGSARSPSESRAATFGEVLRAATPVVWVTPAIVVANIVVYVAMVATGVSPLDPTVEDLFRWGASFGPATAYDHQWWRLLTSAFVHVGAVHLGLNMYVFSQSGPLVERLYGNVAFLSVYVLAALGGSLVATLWSPLAVSAGASGAVFGVYGALFAFTRKEAHGLPAEVAAGLRKGVLSFVVLNVLFGLTVANISNSAHLGGLATGFAAGWLLARPLHAPPVALRRRYVPLAALLAALVALGGAAYYRVARLPGLRESRSPSREEAVMRRQS